MQESGLTDIIPLICNQLSETSVLCYILSFLRAHHRVWLLSDGCYMAGILPFLSSLKAHQLTIHAGCNRWWLWHPLFTVITGNIPFLTSLCATDSRSIHVSTGDPTLFLFYGWVIFHCIYVPHLLNPFLCWRTFRLLPCRSIYRTLCLVNSVAMNTEVHMSFWIMVFSGYMPSSQIAGSLLLFSHSALSDSLWPHGL